MESTQRKVNNYNPKIDFKFALNLWQHRDFYETETFLKPVFFDGVLPTSLTGEMMLKSKSALGYLKTINLLSIEDIDTLINTMGEMQFSYKEKELASLLDFINTSSYSSENISFVFYKSFTSVFSGHFKVELSKLLCAFFSIRHFSYPLIMSIQNTSLIIDMMKNYDLNKNIIAEQFEKMMNFTSGYNTLSNKTSIDEIDKTIKSHMIEMMKVHQIKNVYIFGSYAKNKVTEYSDIDIAVALYPDSSKTKDELTGYFHSILNNKLDVAILTTNVNIDHSMYKNAIKVF